MGKEGIHTFIFEKKLNNHIFQKKIIKKIDKNDIIIENHVFYDPIINEEIYLNIKEDTLVFIYISPKGIMFNFNKDLKKEN